MAGPEDQTTPQTPTPAEDGGSIEVRTLPPIVSTSETPPLPPTNPDLLTGGGVADAHNTAAAPPAAVEADAPVVPAGTTGEFQAAAEGGAAPAARNRRASTRTTGPDGRPQIDFGTAIMEFFHMLSLLLSGRPGAAEEFRLRSGEWREQNVDPIERGTSPFTPEQQREIRSMDRTLQDLSNIGTPNFQTCVAITRNPHVRALLDHVARYESVGGSYDSAWPSTTLPGLSSMTLDQVIAQGRERGREHGSGAQGRYQFIPGTLEGLKRTLGLTGNEVFGPELQDALAVALMHEKGLEGVLAGRANVNQFVDGLARVWQALQDSSGRGPIDNSLGSATVGPAETTRLVQAMSGTGIPGATR
jgi:muramidase (phage lysozyme)